MSRETNRLYYVGDPITYRDLEKKNRSGPALVNGRQLIDMAKKGMSDYRKAMAYTKDKWDIKKNCPIESGTTVEDVIDYVRRRMYLSNFVVIDDDNDDVNDGRNEVNDEVEVDISIDVARGTTTSSSNDDGDDDKEDDDS